MPLSISSKGRYSKSDVEQIICCSPLPFRTGQQRRVMSVNCFAAIQNANTREKVFLRCSINRCSLILIIVSFPGTCS